MLCILFRFIHVIICILFLQTKTLIEGIPKDLENNTRIDVNQMKHFYSTSDYHRNMTILNIAQKLEELKIIRSIVSKQLPPKRYNGIINLFYVVLYPNATSENIQSTLVIERYIR